MYSVLRVVMAALDASKSPQTASRLGIASCVLSFLQIALSITVLIVLLVWVMPLFRWRY